jgi:hypothetical protein
MIAVALLVCGVPWALWLTVTVTFDTYGGKW